MLIFIFIGLGLILIWHFYRVHKLIKEGNNFLNYLKGKEKE